MKCILIPVDFTAVTQDVLSYAAAFCKETSVDQIILFKNFHVPLIAQLLPDANMLEISTEEITAQKDITRVQLDELGAKMVADVPAHVQVISCLTDGQWLHAVREAIEKYQPDLVLLGNDPLVEDNESIISEKIVPFSKASSAPVLIVPKNTLYQKLKKVLIPTSFENLERLRLMDDLCTSQAWLEAEILVLNVDPNGKSMMVREEHGPVLDSYLKNFHYQVTYSGEKEVVETILEFAKDNEVQLIMALPGKHSFLYGLTHKSVTETFALNSTHPVLLLK